METWQKKILFFIEHLPLADSPISVYFLLKKKKVDMRLKKKKMKFYNSNNIAQNQKQVAVSSIESVVKTSTSSCSSGKGQI